MSSTQWFVYILEYSDQTYYIGITNNLEKRLAKHNAGKGARYTRGRLPVRLLKFFTRESKGEALKLEAKLKKLPRAQKLEYIDVILA